MVKVRITNGSMVLDLIEMSTHGNTNTALLRRVSDGMWITCRNIGNDRDGGYSWDWGHYFVYEEKARKDYEKRFQEMVGIEE